METAEKVMGDAAQVETNNAGEEEGGSATTLEELIEQEAEPGVSEQAETEEETEEATEEEPEAEEKAEEETEEETEEEALTEEERAQLKQATTERIEKKIGKAHAKQKEAEERAEASDQEREVLESRVSELESNLESVDVNAAAAASGVSDLYLVETEAALEKRVDEISAGVDSLDDWIDSHIAEDYMTVDSGKEYTFADVKAERRRLSRIVEREAPKARRVLERRVVATAKARKLYPELFKSTSVQHQEMQTLLRTVPGLRVLPNARLIVGQILAGKALEGKPAKAARPATKKLKPTAPKPPETASPAKKRAGSEALNHDPKKVRESGSWDDLV
jgi:hypothetical protein